MHQRGTSGCFSVIPGLLNLTGQEMTSSPIHYKGNPGFDIKNHEISLNLLEYFHRLLLHLKKFYHAAK
jgi:hypothetical protein